MQADWRRTCWREFIGLLSGATASIWPAAALAQTYPSRPITMVVPFAAGGTFDVVGRIIAIRMAELLGQSVIVENVTGGGGIVGVTRVINAASDGYTLLFGTVGTHAYNQWIYKKRRYDATNDFTPVTLFSEQPMVLEARKDLPANDLREFIALLKSNGSKMLSSVPPVPERPHISPARCSIPRSASMSRMYPTGALRPRRTT